MKKLTLLIALGVLLVSASPARAGFGVQGFGLEYKTESGQTLTKAGSHPGSVVTNLQFVPKPDPVVGELPDGAVRDFQANLPEGLVGRPSAVPRCSQADFVRIEKQFGVSGVSACPAATQVGVVVVKGFFNNYAPLEKPLFITEPVFNLEPGPGTVQKLGFYVFSLAPVTVEFSLSQDAPYRVIAKSTNVNQTIPLYSVELHLWGNPASPSHNGERLTCVETENPIEEDRIATSPGCSIESGAPESAYVTLPTQCENPLTANYFAASWLGESVSGVSGGPNLTECTAMGFEPSAAGEPTTRSAGSSSGLDFHLDVNDEGLTNATGVAQSDIRRTEVTLPEGMTVNPSLAEGLGVCTLADLARETLQARPGEGCPESSKIGKAEVETPLLEEPLVGSLYAAKPFENEAGTLLAVYLVIKNSNLGIEVKQTLKVLPDKDTGRLTAIADDIPQLPFSHFRLKFLGGERAPLTSPEGCGTYPTKSVMTPWSGGAPVVSTSTFQITTGYGGGGCGPSSFNPSFEAGTVSPLAGVRTPFVLTLNRAPGSPRLSSIQTTLPEGLLGKLAGVDECTEAQIHAAKALGAPNQGAIESASPSCPQSSEVGTVVVGAGSGAQTFVKGHAYLAGPYEGAPLSLVIITPAVTGPFDLGSVVVRNALYVNPTTTKITAVSDPLPTILQGIPLDIRSIAIDLRRRNFILNPTSCDPMKVTGTATSLLNQNSPLESRFQVGGCPGLAFSPELSIRLSGGTTRAKNPALHAILAQASGQANIDRASVVLPPSEFIDNRHISNPCTRVQFDAGAGNGAECPKKSILGTAIAYTPLLGKPLKGNVYFRSNGGERELPDIVAALGGKINVNLVGFIDSVKVKGTEASRVRTRFQNVPDAPVSKFVLSLYGGKRGLLQNSVNLCKGKRHADAKLLGQNSKTHDLAPVVAVKCGGGKK